MDMLVFEVFCSDGVWFFEVIKWVGIFSEEVGVVKWRYKFVVEVFLIFM